VVNFDLPEAPETYVHRIGRTGRAGAAGVAVSFCSAEEVKHLRGIERLTRRRIEVGEGHESLTATEPTRPAQEPPASSERSRQRSAPSRGLTARRSAAPNRANATPAPSHKRHRQNRVKKSAAAQQESASVLSDSITANLQGINKQSTPTSTKRRRRRFKSAL
jgi:ATP-dependent RNA helicase RhlE